MAVTQQELDRVKPPSTYDRQPVERSYNKFIEAIPQIDEQTPFQIKQIEVVRRVTGPDGSDRSFPVYYYVGRQGEKGRILIETDERTYSFYTLRRLEDAGVSCDSGDFLIRRVVHKPYSAYWDWEETREQYWMDLDLYRKIHPDHVLPPDPFSAEVPESTSSRPRP